MNHYPQTPHTQALQHYYRFLFLPGVDPRRGVFVRSLPGVRGGTAVIRLSTPTSLAMDGAAANGVAVDETVVLMRLSARSAAIVSIRMSFIAAASRGAESSLIKPIPLDCPEARADGSFDMPYVALDDS